jgi:hypothetical protein
VTETIVSRRNRGLRATVGGLLGRMRKLRQSAASIGVSVARSNVIPELMRMSRDSCETRGWGAGHCGFMLLGSQS